MKYIYFNNMKENFETFLTNDDVLVIEYLCDSYKQTGRISKLGYGEVYVSPTGMAKSLPQLGDVVNVKSILFRLCERGYLTLIKKGVASDIPTERRMPIYRIEFGVLTLDILNNKVVKQKYPYKIVDAE